MFKNQKIWELFVGIKFNYRSAAAFNFEKIFTVIKCENKLNLRLKDIHKKMGFLGS